MPGADVSAIDNPRGRPGPCRLPSTRATPRRPILQDVSEAPPRAESAIEGGVPRLKLLGDASTFSRGRARCAGMCRALDARGAIRRRPASAKCCQHKRMRRCEEGVLSPGDIRPDVVARGRERLACCGGDTFRQRRAFANASRRTPSLNPSSPAYSIPCVPLPPSRRSLQPASRLGTVEATCAWSDGGAACGFESVSLPTQRRAKDSFQNVADAGSVGVPRSLPPTLAASATGLEADSQRAERRMNAKANTATRTPPHLPASRQRTARPRCPASAVSSGDNSARVRPRPSTSNNAS